MRYMMIAKLAEGSKARPNYEAGELPPLELMEAIGKLQARMRAEGALLGTGGLEPPTKGAKIKAAKGKLTVTDGPFIESKEVIGGYAIVRAGSLAEAIKMGEEFLQIHLDILGPEYETDLEVREMSEAPECGHGDAKS